MRRLDKIHGMASLVFAACLLLGSGQSAALSTADLLQFPMYSDDPEYDLSTDVISLSQGEDYTFSLSRIGVYNPSGNRPTAGDPSTWTLIRYQASVTFMPGFDPNDYDPYGADDQELLLVMTSFRQGDWDFGDPLPPRVDASFLLGSLADDAHGFVYDPAGGTITDAEGDYFLAFHFAALPGVTQNFVYDVALRESLTGTLQHFNRGYLTRPMPEPASAMAMATLLIGAWVVRRGVRRS